MSNVSSAVRAAELTTWTGDTYAALRAATNIDAANPQINWQSDDTAPTDAQFRQVEGVVDHTRLATSRALAEIVLDSLRRPDALPTAMGVRARELSGSIGSLTTAELISYLPWLTGKLFNRTDSRTAKPKGDVTALDQAYYLYRSARNEGPTWGQRARAFIDWHGKRRVLSKIIFS